MGRIKWGYLGILLSTSISANNFGFTADENCLWYDEEPLISMRTLLRDFGYFGRNLFTGKAAAILAPFVPLWGTSYVFDDRVHHRFYCPKHHRNMHFCSTKLLDLSECLIGLSIGGLTMCSFAVGNRRLQRTAQLYALTLPLTFAAKSLVKAFHWHGNLRPGHGDYPRKNYYGGFPSGHMLEMTYATVLFGLSMGPAFAIPLGLSTTIIAAAFVQTNRHYISQLIAGAAIGTLFGYAAYWAVTRVEEGAPVELSCIPDAQNRQLALRATYQF